MSLRGANMNNKWAGSPKMEDTGPVEYVSAGQSQKYILKVRVNSLTQLQVHSQIQGLQTYVFIEMMHLSTKELG